jgi:hypothetical protein
LSELHTQLKKFGKMIDGKMICFENKRNDFAQNYFADSLESRFHTREKYGSSPTKSVGDFFKALIKWLENKRLTP